MVIQQDPESDRQEFDRRALDELFSLTTQYRSSSAYYELLRFVTRFRFYAPYNALLVHIQMPGAVYVASPQRWRHVFRRRVRAGARPLVILQPMGPVMFVFDVSDTEPEKGAPELPREVLCPFEVRGGSVGQELERTIESAKRDGVEVIQADRGSQAAGSIQPSAKGYFVRALAGLRPEPHYVDVPRGYELVLNSAHSREAQYATLVHELAHLYCGHLGTPNPKWWPDRQGLGTAIQEFEAESVSYLVCRRLGIDSPSADYLEGYLDDSREVPSISLESVFRTAWLIEQMGREVLRPRKERA